MPKKRKLNSKNPKYNKSIKEEKEVLKRELLCVATPTNSLGKKTNSKVPVYGVWYK